jgi:hypothetical protein
MIRSRPLTLACRVDAMGFPTFPVREKGIGTPRPCPHKLHRLAISVLMLPLISNFVLFITAFVLMLLVDDDPTEVTLLEYLMFGVMLYTGFSMFKIMLKLWQDENGPR